MNFEERLALMVELKKLKPGDPRAAQILKSLQTNTPVTDSRGAITLRNPVLGTNVSLVPYKEPKTGVTRYHVAFTGKHGLDSNTVPNTPAEMYGVNAAVSQAVDEITPTKNNPKGKPTQYTFEAINYGDKRGRPNRRALLYRRMTNSAFDAYFNFDQNAMIGHGERISYDKWQAKDAKGRYKPYATWRPGVKEINHLARLAAPVASTLTRGNYYVQAAIIADDLMRYFTGKGVTERQVDQLGKTFKKQPDINLGPILPF